MNEKLMMWSLSSNDLQNVDLVLDRQRIIKTGLKFEPSPYTFTKLENGKRRTADSSSFTPPSWLLMDHSIAVIWSMFNMNPSLQQLSIDDLKWAYEFLKGIKNKKGENPPDVKVCLKEIQDRLINLYAKLTFSKKEELEVAAGFDEKIIQDSTTAYLDVAFRENNVESKFDTLLLSSCKNPLSLTQKQSFKDVSKTGIAKKLLSSTKNTYSFLEESDVCEETEACEDEDVEKYVWNLFGEEKKEEQQSKPNAKSLIPTKKKTDAIATQDINCDSKKKKKTSKKVHCVAEMRSLKFQKSTKVRDRNGEAAYSNLKAEIQRLTINPNVSRDEVMKFLKDWRSEQVDRLHNELKRLSSIEEFMKNLNSEEVEPNLRMNSHLRLRELETEKSIYSWHKRLLPYNESK